MLVSSTPRTLMMTSVSLLSIDAWPPILPAKLWGPSLFSGACSQTLHRILTLWNQDERWKHHLHC